MVVCVCVLDVWLDNIASICLNWTEGMIKFFCGVLQMWKLRSPLLRTQSGQIIVSSLKPGVGQNIALHASPTASNFFLVLISNFPVHSP